MFDIGARAIEAAFAQGLIPVVASVAASEDGATLNINADLLASAFAVRFAASSLFFLTDVDGVYEQFEDKTSMIEELSLTRAEEMLQCGAVSEGMIPKIDACIRAVRGGVEHTRVINGTKRRVLISEVTSNRLSSTIFAWHSDRRP